MLYCNDYLAHYGVKGMKWGVRRYQNKDGTYTSLGKRRKRGDIVIDKGTDVHRIVPKEWLENEKGYSGHAYASYKKKKIFNGTETSLRCSEAATTT